MVSDWVPDQVILDVGTKALGREGNPEKGYGGIAGTKAVLAKLNEYHGFLAVPAGESRPSVGTVVPVVPNHVCPVVNSFEELIVTDSEGTIAAAVAGRRPWTPQLTRPRSLRPIEPDPHPPTQEKLR